MSAKQIHTPARTLQEGESNTDSNAEDPHAVWWKRAAETLWREHSFVLLGLRALWQSLLLLLIPSAIALLVVIPLARITKSAEVDMHLVTHRVSFTLLKGWNSGLDVELLGEVPVKGLTVWTDSIEIVAAELIDDRSGAEIGAKTIQLSPHKDGWVRFKTDTGGLRVSNIRVTSGSVVELSKESQAFGLRISPKDRIQGEISLTGPVKLIAQDCDIVDDGGKPLGLQDGLQQRFSLKVATNQMHIDSSKDVDFQMDLSGEEKDFAGALSEFLQVRDLAFPAGTGAAAVPIEEGSVTFRGVEKPALDLKSAFLKIPGDDVLSIVTIEAKSGALELTASGRIGSLKAGKVPEPDDEELPNLLDWLYHNQKLGVIIGILVWISGTVFGAVKLAGQIKK